MKTVGLAVFGWLVPGGAYLLMRRYLQFAVFALTVTAAFTAGIALHGGLQLPSPEELQGLDPLAALVFQAGGFAKLLAGGPSLVALSLDAQGGFLQGRLHEYGSTMLILAGLFNLLAVASALEARKGEKK